MFNVGLYIPMRISDILKLKVRDVRNKNFISVREAKTGKEQLMPINPILRGILDSYIQEMRNHEFLFASSQKNADGYYTAITRQQAYNSINKAAKHFGLQKIGSLTMRKTFGYHYYQQPMTAMAT